MVDYEAQAEARVRNKPRRIIQSQTLQIVLMILAIFGPNVLAFYVLIVLCTFPVLIGWILFAWIATSIVYSVCYVYVRVDEKKRGRKANL